MIRELFFVKRNRNKNLQSINHFQFTSSRHLSFEDSSQKNQSYGSLGHVSYQSHYKEAKFGQQLEVKKDDLCLQTIIDIDLGDRTKNYYN